MNRIELFKQHVREKRAVKIISGIDNFDIEKAKMVVQASDVAKASCVDISASSEIIKMALETTSLPVFVSSINPSDLLKAVKLGANAIEIGNYDALYKSGKIMDANDILKITKETISLLNGETVYLSVTVPGHIKIEEQIKLAQELEALNVDLIQTEGASISKVNNDNTCGLLEMSNMTIANTIELSRNVNLPIMASSGLTPITVPLAFASGASAIGVGSCVNKLNSVIEMIATSKKIVDCAQNKSKVLINSY